MTDQEEIVIEAACRRLLMRYATAVDRKDYDLYLTVFDAGAVWRRPGQPPLVGVEEIRRYFDVIEAKRRTPEHPDGHVQRHLFTTVHIDIIDADTARGISYALVYRDETPPEGPSTMREPELLVEYDHLFRRTEKGWLIAEHEARHVFRIAAYAQRLSPSEATAIKEG